MTGSVRRVDPDEPWRYRCPECDNPSVHSNLCGFTSGDAPPYRCRGGCGWGGQRVRDASNDQLVDPRGGERGGAVARGAL